MFFEKLYNIFVQFVEITQQHALLGIGIIGSKIVSTKICFDSCSKFQPLTLTQPFYAIFTKK
jgi:hypothetical protein